MERVKFTIFLGSYFNSNE